MGIGTHSYHVLNKIRFCIEYEIIGEGSQISTNQKPGNSAFSLLIGQNLRPFPDNFVLYILLQ